MPDKAIPVKVTLQNEGGKEVASTTINALGKHRFDNLPPTKYTITRTPPSGVKVRPRTCQHNLTGEKNSLEIEITSKDLGTTNIPLGLITLAAVSMTLLQNVTLVEDFSSFFSPEKTVQNRRIQSSSKSRTINPNDQYGLVLSPQVEGRLRKCLQENLKKLLRISSLSELID